MILNKFVVYNSDQKVIALFFSSNLIASSHLGLNQSSKIISEEEASALVALLGVVQKAGTALAHVTETTDDALEVSIELGVLLEGHEALAVSADHSLQGVVRLLLLLNLLSWSGNVEGQGSLFDHLLDGFDGCVAQSKVNNLFDNVVLDRVVGQLSSNGLLGDLSNGLVMVSVDILDVILKIFVDFFDLAGGVGGVGLVLDDVGGLFVGLLNDILDH